MGGAGCISVTANVAPRLCADFAAACAAGDWARALTLHDRLFDLHKAMFSDTRSEEHTSELQSLMRISYAVFCLKKKNNTRQYTTITQVLTTPSRHTPTALEIPLQNLALRPTLSNQIK